MNKQKEKNANKEKGKRRKDGKEQRKVKETLKEEKCHVYIATKRKIKGEITGRGKEMRKEKWKT